jgi:hypothetical protein
MAASLTQTSTIARKIIRYTIYAVILIIVARFTIKTGVRIYRNFFPQPPPAPTVAFGKLPNLPFPEKEIPNLSYSLETPEGEFPTFPKQLGVYFMPKKSPSIRALEIAQEKVALLGFKSDGTELVETVYVFRYDRVPVSLTMNIVSGIFSISFDLNSDPTVIERIPPAPEVAASRVQSYLSRAKLLEKDLAGPVTHEFIKIEQGRFVEALSLSEADLIQVNLFRKSFGDDIPSVTPDPTEANVWFMLSGEGRTGRQTIAAEYHYFPVDENQSATYPLKTAQDAWEELKAAGGYIASLGDNQAGNITVRRVYLAYYDPGQYTEFYQPVVVFEGDGDFVAYVPAVTSEFYGE